MTDAEIKEALKLHKKVTGEEAPKATPPPKPAANDLPSFKMKFDPVDKKEGTSIATLTDKEGKVEISLSLAQWLILCTNIIRKLPHASGNEKDREEVEILATFSNVSVIDQLKGLMDVQRAQVAQQSVAEALHPQACEPGCEGDSKTVQHKFMNFITDRLEREIISGEAFKAKNSIPLLVLLSAYAADLDTHGWDSEELLGPNDPVLKCIAFFLAANTNLLQGKIKQKVANILRKHISEIFGEDLEDDDEEEQDDEDND
jgi:hypothetical protein